LPVGVRLSRRFTVSIRTKPPHAEVARALRLGWCGPMGVLGGAVDAGLGDPEGLGRDAHGPGGLRRTVGVVGLSGLRMEAKADEIHPGRRGSR